MPRIVSLAGGLVGAAAIAAFAAAPTAYAADLSGSSFGVKVDLSVGGTKVVNETLPKPVSYPSGGKASLVELDSREITGETNGFVKADIITAASNVTGGKLTSRASVVDLTIGGAAPAELAQLLEGAALVEASLVTAKCSIGSDGKISAESNLVEVRIGGVGKAGGQEFGGAREEKISIAPNTKVEVPGVGTVILNEQITSAKGVTVNAIHIKLDPELGLVSSEIIVSQATCFTGAGGGPSPDPSDSASPGPSDSASPSEPPATATPTDTAPGGGGGDGDLPDTGTSLGLIAGAGAALLTAGGVAVWLTRRRKAEGEPEVS